jgi:glycine cleavage system H lipoate-binding protein
MVALFVILTIVAFLLIDVAVQKIQNQRAEVPSTDRVPLTNSVYTAAVPRFTLASLSEEAFVIPKGLFFHKGHTWAKILSSGKVRIGLDGFMQRVVGRIDAIDVPEIGRRVRLGERVFSLTQGNRKMSLPSPVEGVITSVNNVILGNPGGLKADPYGDGWLCTVEPVNLVGSLNHLRIAEDAITWFRAELSRFKDFISGSVLHDDFAGQTLYDGGIPIEGLLERFDDKAWSVFQEEFLKQ